MFWGLQFNLFFSLNMKHGEIIEFWIHNFNIFQTNDITDYTILKWPNSAGTTLNLSLGHVVIIYDLIFCKTRYYYDALVSTLYVTLYDCPFR